MPTWLFAALMLAPPAEPVHWDAPEACPDARQLIEDAEALSGRTVADAVGLEVRGTVRPSAGGSWVLSLTISTPSGAQARELEAGSCEDLTDVAATLLAVALQEPAVVPPPAPPQEEPPPPKLPEATPPPVSDGEPVAPWRAVLGVTASVGLGPLPGPAAALSISAGAERGRGRVEAEAEFWLPRDARVADGEAGGSIALWTVGARGCGVPGVGRVRVPLCAGVQAGQMVGRGERLDAPRRAALPWLAGEVVAGLRVGVHPNLALRADLSALVPVLRPGFTVDGLGTVHRAALVGGTGGLGLEARFP